MISFPSNLYFFQTSHPSSLPNLKPEEQHHLVLRGPTSSVLYALGVVPPLDGDGIPAEPEALEDHDLIYRGGDFCFMVIREAEKLIDKALLKASVEERIETRAAELGRELTGDEKNFIRTDVISALAADAPIEYRDHPVYWWPKAQMLAVGASKLKDADRFAGLIRKLVGLPDRPSPWGNITPAPMDAMLTRALRVEKEVMVEGLRIGNACQIYQQDTGTTWSINKADLVNDDAVTHLLSAKMDPPCRVKKLALDKVRTEEDDYLELSFKLVLDGGLKAIKPGGVVKHELASEGEGDRVVHVTIIAGQLRETGDLLRRFLGIDDE